MSKRRKKAANAGKQQADVFVRHKMQAMLHAANMQPMIT